MSKVAYGYQKWLESEIDEADTRAQSLLQIRDYRLAERARLICNVLKTVHDAFMRYRNENDPFAPAPGRSKLVMGPSAD